MKDPVLLQAFHSWQELSMTEAELWEYEGRLKRLLDDEAAARERELALLERNEAMQEKELALREKEVAVQEKEAAIKALENTKQQIEEVKIQAQEHEFKIVRNMLSKGFDDETIVELTNATLEEVQKLRNEISIE